MKLTVIGMWGGFPKAGGASSGYLLESNGSKLLLDCGSAVLSRLLELCNLTELDGVVISHYHADHCCDLMVLEQAYYVLGLRAAKIKPLPIFGHANSAEFQSLTYRNGSVTQGYAYQPGEAFQVGAFTITPVRTVHPLECYGFRICAEGKSLFFTADGAYGPHLQAAADQVDLLLCESNFTHADLEYAKNLHMTAIQAGSLAAEVNAKRLLLTHLNPLSNNDQILLEAKSKYHGPAELAYCGQTVEF